MAPKPTRSWEVIRRQKPLNEKQVAMYERLMEAEERIAQARTRHGETEATIEGALALSEAPSSQTDSEEDVYLGVLTRYVAALGGHLEVVAVFPEERIVVRREPRDVELPDGPSGPSGQSGPAAA